jgi:hypothetical protein
MISSLSFPFFRPLFSSSAIVFFPFFFFRFTASYSFLSSSLFLLSSFSFSSSTIFLLYFRFFLFCSIYFDLLLTVYLSSRLPGLLSFLLSFFILYYVILLIIYFEVYASSCFPFPLVSYL